MRTWLWHRAAWVVALGLACGVGRAEEAPFVVTLVVPRGDQFVEPAEGLMMFSRRPIVFHVRIMNTAGETKAMQADLAGACALELTDRDGVTTRVTRKVVTGEAEGDAVLRDLANGDTVRAEIPFDPAHWEGVPDLARRGQVSYDVRAVYRSVNGKTTYSKSYTAIFRL